jgi:hypothetical protein
MKSLEAKSSKLLRHAAFAMAPFLIVAGLLAPAIVKARLGTEGVLGSQPRGVTPESDSFCWNTGLGNKS